MITICALPTLWGLPILSDDIEEKSQHLSKWPECPQTICLGREQGGSGLPNRRKIAYWMSLHEDNHKGIICVECWGTDLVIGFQGQLIFFVP